MRSEDLAGQPITVDLAGAAAIMKVHPNTVTDSIKSGELPAAKVGRGWVMMTRDVVALVERRIVQQTCARMGLTKAARPASSRAGSRSAPAS